jgi:glycine/D-amino acid oxidase-like deaminating enzyme
MDRAPAPAPTAPLAEQITADVVVIGCGFTGLRAALTVLEGGGTVALLDAGDVGFGASGRTGGQVNPMLPFNTPDKLNKILGRAYFERLTETSLASADALFDFIKRYQIDCEARQNGWLRVCHTPKALAAAKAGVTEWNRHGAGMQILSRSDIEHLAGTRAYGSGVLTPKGGAVHPMMLVQGMAAAARARGADLFGQSAVLDLQQNDGRWIAKTAQGQVTAQTVIVATNGYTGDLIPKLDKTVIPIAPIQIATEPLPDDVISSILPQGHTISDSRRVIMYARREPDNRMVYGGHGTPLKGGGLGGFDWLIRDAIRVFPQLKGVRWTHRWGGHIALTEDRLPHLHEPKPGLLIGLGYNGRGVAMSQIMGETLGKRALGTPAEDLPFPVTQIKPMTGRGTQLFGMRTAIWIMKFMDYLETR